MTGTRRLASSSMTACRVGCEKGAGLEWAGTALGYSEKLSDLGTVITPFYRHRNQGPKPLA